MRMVQHHLDIAMHEGMGDKETGQALLHYPFTADRL